MRRLLFILCALALTAPAFGQTTVYQTAARNAVQANDALNRCRRVLNAWYARTGKGNLLLPRTTSQREWVVNDTASDMWAHFVNAAFVLGDPVLEAKTRGTLVDVMRLTTRLDRLPDGINIDTGKWIESSPDKMHILFGAAEEVKDGLTPIIDLTGQRAYVERARVLLEDVMENGVTKTKYGVIPDNRAETNGDMLEALCRLYGATRDPNMKKWAERIGDAWIFQVLPNTNGLPCHVFDFSDNKPDQNELRLLDHGNEIVVGLVELLNLEYVHDRARYDKYRPSIEKMMDRLVDHAVDADGIWYVKIRPTDYKVLSPGGNAQDTWGYTTNAVYAMYLMTGKQKYLDHVNKAMRSVATKPAYLSWGWLNDSWADAIEGGILLYNRIATPEMAAWLEKIVPKFLAMQKADGTVMATYLDGNYVRTALMWAQMKTAGTRLVGGRADVKYGATVSSGKLYLHLSAATPWSGAICFDYARYRMNMGLKMDYPRINQYPQWYTIDPDGLYDVTVNGQTQGPILGQELIEGYAVSVGSTPTLMAVWRHAGSW